MDSIKQLLSTIFISFIPLLCFSQPINETEAMDNVVSFLSMKTLMNSSQRTKSKIHLSGKFSGLYAFDYDGGFVLASSNAQMPPILGYSDKGCFADAINNPCYRAFIKQYSQIYRSDFHIYKPHYVAEAVEPLCHDNWHQYSPFNDMCPLAPDGESRCTTGCVANSMAELMNYYDYPLQGTGYLEHNDSTGSGEILTSDLSSHTYDWAHILDNYSNSYSTSDSKAVSQLLYDCGLSVHMRYGSESSGAQIIYQPIALVNNFGYDEGMQLYYRNFFNQVEWDSIMFNELNEGRPMLVGGWTGSGGHSYICDGYDKNGMFHLRMGYPDAEGTGYYYFNWSTPDLPQWLDVNSPEAGFNVLQSILVGVKPKEGDTPSHQRYIYVFSSIKTLSGDSETYSRDSCIPIGVYDLCNCGWNIHKGKVGIALKPVESARTTSISSTPLLYTYDRVFSLEELTDSIYSDTININILPDIENGKYKLVPVYEENGAYVEARTMLGVPNYLECTISESLINIDEVTNGFSNLEISNLYFPSIIYKHTCPEYGFTLTNNGSDYSGRLYISLYDEVVPTYNRVFSIQGVHIESGEVQQYKFVRTNILNFPIGDSYHLRIRADKSLLNDDMTLLYDDSITRIEVQVAPTSISDELKTEKSVFIPIYYDLSGRRIISPSHSSSKIVIEISSDGTTRKIVNN